MGSTCKLSSIVRISWDCIEDCRFLDKDFQVCPILLALGRTLSISTLPLTAGLGHSQDKTIPFELAEKKLSYNIKQKSEAKRISLESWLLIASRREKSFFHRNQLRQFASYLETDRHEIFLKSNAHAIEAFPSDGQICLSGSQIHWEAHSLGGGGFPQSLDL